MSVRSLSPIAATDVIAFYMSGNATEVDRDAAAELTGAVVFRGQDQRDQARRARRRGAMVWLDPADYQRPHRRRDQLSLFGDDPWAVEQRAIGVVELLSPGVEVPTGDLDALDMAITSQSKWLEAEGGGRLSLALPWRWLTVGLDDLLSAFELVDVPIAVAFGDPKDPLKHKGAVQGLAALSRTVSDLMILRCDMGGFGALAHGAKVATIGTSTSVRHFVPAGRQGYSSARRVLDVFVESLLDFRDPAVLLRLPGHLKPKCALACCGGADLDRFLYTDDAAGARRHNLHSLASVAGRILAVGAPARAAVWREMAAEAVVAAERIHREAGPFEVRAQIAAWARL